MFQAFARGRMIISRRHRGAAALVEGIVDTERNRDQMRAGGTRYGSGVRHVRADYEPCRKSAVVY